MDPNSINRNEEVPERPGWRSNGTTDIPFEAVEWWRELLRQFLV